MKKINYSELLHWFSNGISILKHTFMKKSSLKHLEAFLLRYILLRFAKSPSYKLPDNISPHFLLITLQIGIRIFTL